MPNTMIHTFPQHRAVSNQMQLKQWPHGPEVNMYKNGPGRPSHQKIWIQIYLIYSLFCCDQKVTERLLFFL